MISSLRQFRAPLGRLVLALAATAVLCSPVAEAQQRAARQAAARQPGTPAREGNIVRAIEVRFAGPASVSRERILSNMRTTVGQPFSQSGIEDDVRNLYRTGDVSNVRIFGEQMGGGVRVIVIVQGRLVVKEIVIEGAGRVPAKRIQRALKTKEGNALSEEVIEADRQSILELYQGRGFGDADVQYKVTRDEAAGNAIVYFAINEGGKSALHYIRIEGNANVRTRFIRKEMKNTKPKTIFTIFTKDGRLDQALLREDLDAVREMYQNRGFIDMQVTQTRTERDSQGRVTLIVTISEGPQYRVNSFGVSGNKVLTEKDLRRFLKMKENSLYTPKGLKDDLKIINDFYGARGYVDVQVQPVAEPAGPGRVNLSYRIVENSISYLERINIEGNSVTKDKVIRRELPLAPGDVYSTVFADVGKKRLENLNYFQKVEVNPSDTLVEGRKDMNVVLEEKRTGELSFGLGFSSVDKLVGQASLTQGNFDIFNWPTFTGGGQKFRMAIAYGQTRRDFSMAFTEPYIFDTRNAVSVEAYYRDTNYSDNDYNQRNFGGAIGLRRPLWRQLVGRLEYRFEDIRIAGVSDATAQILLGEQGSRTRSAVTAGLGWDTRDSYFLTRRGTRLDLSVFVAGSILGGTTKTYGFNFEFGHWITLPYDIILTAQGQIQGVAALSGNEISSFAHTNTSRRVPIYDRLFLGGATTLRGFDYREVGPRDANNNPLGGRSLARITFEGTFPIVERVRGAVFYDGGVNHRKSWSYGMSRYASDVGVGLRLDLPVGPIRIDYGFPLTREDERQSKKGRFNFNVGYQF